MAEEAPVSEPFGFSVIRVPEPKLMSWPAGWWVYLPHQCDSWDVAGAAFAPLPHDQAVATLERFIAEAQEALARLRAGESYDAAEDST